MIYKSLSNIKEKRRTLWEDAQSQNIDISNLKNKFIYTKQHTLKHLNKIIITENNPDASVWQGEFYLQDIPEWMISMIYPVGYFKAAEDAIDLEKPELFGASFSYLFYKISDNIYRFQYKIDATIDTTELEETFELDQIYIPNVYLYIYNLRNYDTLAKAKK